MERGFSRRTFLKLASLALFAEGCQQARENTALGFVFPDTRLQSTVAYKKILSYTAEELRNLTIIGFGDSNLNGRFLPDRKPLPHVAVDLARERNIGNWTAHNLSYVGATTAQALHNQVRRADIVSFMNGVGPFDCWINVGGNDVNPMFNTPEGLQELQQLMDNPLRLSVFSFVSRLYRTISEIGPHYFELLEGIQNQYKDKLNRFVLITPSNFANAPEIHIGQTEEDTTKFKLDTWYKQFFVHQASVLINQEVCQATERFVTKYPQRQVIAIDTFGFDQSCFLNDQHYSRKGQLKIVEEVLRRSVVTK